MIEIFIKLPYEQKKQIGIKGREKVSKQFNRKIIVNEYFKAINNILEDK